MLHISIIEESKAVFGEERTQNYRPLTTPFPTHILCAIVCPIRRVMHNNLFPLILLLINLRPANVNKVAYIPTVTYSYIH